MPAFSTCSQCGYNAEGAVTACPRCGGATRIVQESRARAWILIFCGLVLIGMMGTILAVLAPSMLHAGKEAGDGMRFGGTAEQGRMILLLFGVIIAFGCTSLAYGIYQLIMRRESKAFMIFTFVMTGVLILVVWLATASIGKPGL